MANVYGALGLQDTNRVYLNTLGQDIVWDAVTRLLDEHNADLNAARSIFIERETPDYKLRYLLPGGGRLQKIGQRSQAGAVKATGSWDVAFPLEEWGAQVAANRVALAYMTTQEFQRHVDTVFAQDINTVRFEILKALFNSSEDTFVDELYGSLLIEPLANGDAVVYPALEGSEDGATDNHYLESGYAASAISDTNNPYLTMRDELAEHFGNLNGSEIVVFINSAQTAKTTDLTDFDEVDDRFVRVGADSDQVINLPAGLPGRVVGRTNGVWVVEWAWMPANYMLALNISPDAPKPLIMRIDAPETGLGTGLQLVAEGDVHPFYSAHYAHRFGIGAGNRLNGVVMELGSGGTYTIPTLYA
jgi:hypothetical protein